MSGGRDDVREGAAIDAAPVATVRAGADEARIDVRVTVEVAAAPLLSLGWRQVA